MSDAYFNPQLFGAIPPAPNPMPPVESVPPMVPTPMPIDPIPAPIPNPQPIFIPVPIMPKVEKPKGLKISPEAAKKAQTIYPQEKQEKQQMINNAKAPPTPTGAWGAAQ